MATAYIASFAFVATFLVTTLCGNSGQTALTRGALVGAVALVLGRFLTHAVVEVVMAAMARDRAAKAAQDASEEDR